ncbi:DDE-type integrase/transposase/recombinase [bacterium]|nr:DDE-type integrase/transposase/recombinase [bacterium]
MDSEKKEKIAIFRFGVIFPLVECNTHEHWGKKERILKEQVSTEWSIPYSNRTFISRATILNWVSRYEKGGWKIEALYPKDRGDRGRSRSIDSESMDALITLRADNPNLSVRRLVERARSSGLLPGEKDVSMATVYRFMKQHKLKRKIKQKDMRKFEVQMSNDLWQSDCMHGGTVIHEGKIRKTYLFAIIDDHSRLITHGQFYLAENIDNYLNCIWTAMKKRGVPRKLYVDNGPSFRSHRLKLGCAGLGISLSYARPYRPQGKGKIERYFRTVRGQFMTELPENPTLSELNERFFNYVENIYHTRIHGTTGQTPIERYLKDGQNLRRAPDDLPEYFRKKEIRLVNKDRTVKLDGLLFEAPVGLVGQKVTLRYENHYRIEVFVDDISKGFLSPLDPHINSRMRRDRIEPDDPKPTGGKLFESNSIAGGF